MTRGGIPIAALVLLLAFAATAVAEESTVEPRSVDLRFIVESGRWAELNLEMEASGSFEWDVRTIHGEEIYIDLHSHDGPQVLYHEQFDASSGESGTFTADEAGIYSILVENGNPENVTVRLQVDGVFGVDSMLHIEPLEHPPEDQPSPVGPIPLFGALLVLVALRRLAA